MLEYNIARGGQTKKKGNIIQVASPQEQVTEILFHGQISHGRYLHQTGNKSRIAQLR